MKIIDFVIGLLIIVLAPIWVPLLMIKAILMSIHNFGKWVRTDPSRACVLLAQPERTKK